MITRRLFLRQSGLAAIGLGITPLFLSRSVRALVDSITPRPGKVFVLIIQRGAMDGLSLLPPVADPYYLPSRPNIGLGKTGAQDELRPLPLDSRFALHPSMQSLVPLWNSGTLAFVHQVGSPDHSRSHFDAQDFLESGTPGNKNTQEGFLNRAMETLPRQKSAVRAVAIQPSLPRILQGSFPAISMNSIQEFNIRTDPNHPGEVQGFESMYQEATDHVFRGVGQEVFDSLKTIHSLSKEDKGKNELYPKTAIGKKMREIATLIQAGVGVQVAVTDMGGWDTHVNQGSAKGQLSDRFKELSEAIAAFAKDLGPGWSDVCLATVTEFGRTVKENGTRGTDHGHGSVMMIAGGTVQGKKVYGRWKELAPANLFEGRDLPVTTDARDVFSEILSSQLGISQWNKVFPNYQAQRSSWLGLLKA